MANKEKFFNIRIDDKTKEKLRKLAERNNRTMSGQMIHMIKRAK